MRSSRSSLIAALTVVLALAAGAAASAHRRDEYLQAARLAIDPDRVQVELDLTPGISVADAVLADLDVDRDGQVSPAEADAYARTVLRGIALDVDGAPLTLRLMGRTFPSIDGIRNGVGTIRIQLSAPAPGLVPGVHYVHYRNAHRPDIGVYLANALVPASARVAITDQQRDVDQRNLRVDYQLTGGAPGEPVGAIALGLTGGLIAIAVVWQRRRLSLNRG